MSKLDAFYHEVIVLGVFPNSEEGKRFRDVRNRWSNITDYVSEIAPEIAERCEFWDGPCCDGLTKFAAHNLADRLAKELDSRRTAQYVNAHKVEVCDCCHEGLTEDGDDCEECDGVGKFKSHFTIEDVQEFLTFLRASNGFMIAQRQVKRRISKSFEDRFRLVSPSIAAMNFYRHSTEAKRLKEVTSLPSSSANETIAEQLELLSNDPTQPPT
jgi:hypothetical protein